MREVILDEREERTQVYLPEKCIGCGTCVQICPKGELVIGSVGAVARGLIDKEFIEKRMTGACVFCALCARVCPTGALEMRVAGKAEKDDSYLSFALNPTLVDERCVHCGLCAEVCPWGCIELEDRRLAGDGSLRLEGKTLIDLDRCVHCGWCAAVCPKDAITFQKPFAGEFSRNDQICQACRTCVDVCPANALFNREWQQGELVEKVTHLHGCLGCGNCVFVCPGNALSDPYLAAGHLNELEKKPLLEVENGAIVVVDQDACGSCATCSLICPTEAIWLERREVV